MMQHKAAASLNSSLFARKGKASPARRLISELEAGAEAAGGSVGVSPRRKPRAEPELPLLAFVEEQIEAEEAAAGDAVAVEKDVEVEVVEAAVTATPVEPAPAASLLERGTRPLRRVNGHAAPSSEASPPAQAGAPRAGDPADENAAEHAGEDAAGPETVSGDANVAAIEDAPEESGDGLAAVAPQTPTPSAAEAVLADVVESPAAAVAAGKQPPDGTSSAGDGKAAGVSAAAAAIPETSPEKTPDKAPVESASATTPSIETLLTLRKTEAAMAASVALRHAQNMNAGSSSSTESQEEMPPPAPAARGSLWRAAAVLALGAALGFGAYLVFADRPAEFVPVKAALPPPTAAPAPAVTETATAPEEASTAAPPQAGASPAEGSPAETVSAAAEEALPEPSFDIIRIEPDGQSIIAGRAEPFSEWILLNNGAPIASLRADANGEWVVLPDASLVPGANAFSLVPKSERGKVSIPAPAAPAPQSDAAPAADPSGGAAPSLTALDGGISLPRRKPETVQATALPAALPLSPGGGAGYEVQLASVRQNGDALRERDRLAGTFSDLLGGLALRVEEAAVDGAGTFYRVRSAAIADLGMAREICRRLEAGGQGCLVVRRAAAPAPTPATEVAEDLPHNPATAAGQQAERPR